MEDRRQLSDAVIAVADQLVALEGDRRRLLANERAREARKIAERFGPILARYAAARGALRQFDDARRCRYTPVYSGRCNAEVEPGTFCAAHTGKLCTVCGKQATNECNHTGQFVCGAQLCDDCTGEIESTKPSGAWGFANHSHRPKAEDERRRAHA